VLQVLAIVHWVRRRPETYWLWIILIGGGLGALIYIVAEVVPDASLLAQSMQRLSRRRRIKLLEAVVLQNAAIGNVEELADLLLEERQFARARALYDKVLAGHSDSHSLDPIYRRGIACLELGDAAAAVADLDRVVAKDPKYDFNRALGLLGHAHALAGHAEKADAIFKNAVAVSMLSETYYNYATFLSAQNRAADAREFAQRILASKATVPRYLQRRDRIWYR
jgi:hypothetical protein